LSGDRRLVTNINIILAIFNLVPAYPLDGGRVLSGLLWGISGDRIRATRWAASGGRLFGSLLMALGIAMILGVQIPFFGTGFVGGLWLLFIGWFLSRHQSDAGTGRRSPGGHGLPGGYPALAGAVRAATAQCPGPTPGRVGVNR